MSIVLRLKLVLSGRHHDHQFAFFHLVLQRHQRLGGGAGDRPAIDVEVAAVAGAFEDIFLLAPDDVAGKMGAGRRKNGDFIRAVRLGPDEAALGKNDPPVFDHEFVGEHFDLSRLEVFGRSAHVCPGCARGGIGRRAGLRIQWGNP